MVRAGEWILTNKGWHRTPDPSYYDVMTIFDVSNSFGHFQRVEAGDYDWSLPGNKNHIEGAWSAPDGPGTRAKLTVEWRAGAYPTSISSQAAVYVTRSPIYLGGDAQALGLVP